MPPFIQLDFTHQPRRTAKTPTPRLTCINNQATLHIPGQPPRPLGDTLAGLHFLESSLKPGNQFAGQTWLGFLSYDLGRHFEPLPATAPDDLNLPEYDFLLESGEEGTKARRHEGTKGKEDQNALPPLPPSGLSTQHSALPSPLRASVPSCLRASYISSVSRAIDYIRAGDIFQVNLSHRLTLPTTRSPQQIYDTLQSQSPAPYAALLDFEDYALISNSPELFLQITPDSQPTTPSHPKATEQPRPRSHKPESSSQHPEPKTPAPLAESSFTFSVSRSAFPPSPLTIQNSQFRIPPRTITTRPIKGTRPNAPGMHDQLLHSEKDQAELNMIIDLERNDLGRVCEIGSVKVTQPRTIETHPTVLHGVATIQGQLRPHITLVDLLQATFPGGSVTGAPKIRAMQIIEELEPTRRGPYTGAIGYISYTGEITFNLAIRTILLTKNNSPTNSPTQRPNLAHIQVGAGIVADSHPEEEYEETITKAQAMLAALTAAP